MIESEEGHLIHLVPNPIYLFNVSMFSYKSIGSLNSAFFASFCLFSSQAIPHIIHSEPGKVGGMIWERSGRTSVIRVNMWHRSTAKPARRNATKSLLPETATCFDWDGPKDMAVEEILVVAPFWKLLCETWQHGSWETAVPCAPKSTL